mmetsp:Transcript_4024/g.6674  ORF Transcript_4024/g.6674 Transcript_4024/m.6674 type:complete len:80 (+) Transcript_4024:663-902(+)
MRELGFEDFDRKSKLTQGRPRFFVSFFSFSVPFLSVLLRSTCCSSSSQRPVLRYLFDSLFVSCSAAELKSLVPSRRRRR